VLLLRSTTAGGNGPRERRGAATRARRIEAGNAKRQRVLDEGWFVSAKRRGQGGRKGAGEARQGSARARARAISGDFNISSRPRRAEQRRCLIILITMPRSIS